MEVVGDHAPVFYYDELSTIQRAALKVFATELALRFEVIEPYLELDPIGDPDIDPPVVVKIEASAEKDLSAERELLIESFGVDPLRVMPGSRPS